jgi:predicted TIM-barrel fold metal-dependent hydrolase
VYALLALAVLLVVLLAFFGPLGTLVEHVFAAPPMQRGLALAGSHKALVGAGGAIAALAVGAWLVRGRRWRALRALAVVGLLVVLAYATHEFRTVYPRADLFSTERLRDMSTIALGTDVPLSRFEPQPMLQVARATPLRAAYPAIDVHFHLGSLPPSITPERLVQAMDAAGIAKVVNLDGSAPNFRHFVDTFRAKYPDRFIQFVKPDFTAIRRPGGIEAEARRIVEAAREGALGLKVSKSLGLSLRDASGARVPLDDPRLDAIWNTAGRLGLPVLVHTADPPAFFLPTTRHNERYEELVQNPGWSRADDRSSSFAGLMAERERLLAKHPGTVFIGAHMGSNEEDLAYAGRLLERFPNYYVDLSSRVAGLGRQPYTAREFFIRWQDRILFGSDGGFALQPDREWTPERFFRSYVEFLETPNEYVEYPLWGALNQGRWRVTGLHLPPDVLEKIYARNAERLLPTPAALQARLAEFR